MISEFDQGMQDSFAHEDRIMGESIEANGIAGRAVVDAVEASKGLSGALISDEVSFDVYVVAAEFERLNIIQNGKVKLTEPYRLGYEGRVKSILPIEGGQYRVRIGTSTPR
jgi:hypothetical protein